MMLVTEPCLCHLPCLWLCLCSPVLFCMRSLPLPALLPSITIWSFGEFMTVVSHLPSLSFLSPFLFLLALLFFPSWLILWLSQKLHSQKKVLQRQILLEKQITEDWEVGSWGEWQKRKNKISAIQSQNERQKHLGQDVQAEVGEAHQEGPARLCCALTGRCNNAAKSRDVLFS